MIVVSEYSSFISKNAKGCKQLLHFQFPFVLFFFLSLLPPSSAPYFLLLHFLTLSFFTSLPSLSSACKLTPSPPLYVPPSSSFPPLPFSPSLLLSLPPTFIYLLLFHLFNFLLLHFFHFLLLLSSTIMARYWPNRAPALPWSRQEA